MSYPIDFLVAGAHPGNRTDIVGYRYESGIGKIFPRNARLPINEVHLSEAVELKKRNVQL